MLGLRVTRPAGETWLLQPASVAELDFLRGGFTTRLGRFSASITVETKYIEVQWDTPKGTRGFIDLPELDSFWVSGGKGKKNLTR